MLAVCVDFEIDPASLAAFLPLMQKNAAESLANEAGCHQFDITQDPQNLTKIFLYELYDDAAALRRINRQAITLSSMRQPAG